MKTKTLSDNPTILIAGNFSFPDGNAAGKRVLGIAYLLSDMGYRVFLLGCNETRNTESIVDTRTEISSFVYYCFHGGRSILNKIDYRNHFSEFVEVVNIIGNQSLKGVILYGSPSLALWNRLVIRYMHRIGKPVIFDCVDWMEVSGFSGIVTNLAKYIDTNYMKRVLAVRCDGVITISRYLYEYYSKKVQNTLLLPPVGKASSNNNRNSIDKIHFIFAGAISKKRPLDWNCEKDRIDKSIELLNRANAKGVQFEFHIYGIEEVEYLSAKPEHSDIIRGVLKGSVIFHGRVNNKTVCQAMREADIMILNRDVSKVTTAGFPSKVAESLCEGVPVMTNDTSNISDYVINNENGWIISFDNSEAVETIVELYCNKDDIIRIKNNCRSDCKLDYRLFADVMKDFLKKTCICDEW